MGYISAVSRGNRLNIESYENDDGSVYDFTTYKGGNYHGLRFMYATRQMDSLEFKGFFKEDNEIGFWKCVERFI